MNTTAMASILVIEAERQVAFNQQTQMIRLRGLVRPSDVNASNQVLSTAVTEVAPPRAAASEKPPA